MAGQANGLALSDQVWAEQVELDFTDDVGDARLTGLAGREVTGFLGLAGAGPAGAVPGEGAGGEDFELERGESEVLVLRGKSRDGVRRGGQGMREADRVRGDAPGLRRVP